MPLPNCTGGCGGSLMYSGYLERAGERSWANGRWTCTVCGRGGEGERWACRRCRVDECYGCRRKDGIRAEKQLTPSLESMTTAANTEEAELVERLARHRARIAALRIEEQNIQTEEAALILQQQAARTHLATFREASLEAAGRNLETARSIASLHSVERIDVETTPVKRAVVEADADVADVHDAAELARRSSLLAAEHRSRTSLAGAAQENKDGLLLIALHNGEGDETRQRLSLQEEEVEEWRGLATEGRKGLEEARQEAKMRVEREKREAREKEEEEEKARLAEREAEVEKAKQMLEASEAAARAKQAQEEAEREAEERQRQEAEAQLAEVAAKAAADAAAREAAIAAEAEAKAIREEAEAAAAAAHEAEAQRAQEALEELQAATLLAEQAQDAARIDEDEDEYEDDTQPSPTALDLAQAFQETEHSEEHARLARASSFHQSLAALQEEEAVEAACLNAEREKFTHDLENCSATTRDDSSLPDVQEPKKVDSDADSMDSEDDDDMYSQDDDADDDDDDDAAEPLSAQGVGGSVDALNVPALAVHSSTPAADPDTPLTPVSLVSPGTDPDDIYSDDDFSEDDDADADDSEDDDDDF